jgi:hypothetical protein
MKSIQVNFNKKIYSQKTIAETIDAFGDLADFKINSKGDYHIVNIFGVDGSDAEKLKGEFCNYVLGSMVNNKS